VWLYLWDWDVLIDFSRTVNNTDVARTLYWRLSRAALFGREKTSPAVSQRKACVISVRSYAYAHKWNRNLVANILVGGLVATTLFAGYNMQISLLRKLSLRKQVLACAMSVGRVFFPGGAIVDFSRWWPKAFVQEGPTVVKFHFTSSKL